MSNPAAHGRAGTMQTLSYASINWIRFKGRQYRAYLEAPAGLSAPTAGLP
jgi:hypothetical protein